MYTHVCMHVTTVSEKSLIFKTSLTRRRKTDIMPATVFSANDIDHFFFLDKCI